jgi:hypothetical protein
MTTNKTSENECRHFIGKRAWKIIGGVALALIATGIISQLHDIRRYIKITTM